MTEELKKQIAMIYAGEVPEDYERKNLGIMPIIWQNKPMKKVVTPIKDKAGNRTFETLSISAGKGFVNQAEKFGKEMSGAQYVNYTVIKNGDFSYNKGNSKKYPQGCIYMLDDRETAAVPNVFNSFRIKDSNPQYYKHLFISGFMNKQLFRLINSGVRNDGLLNLYDDDFYNCYLPVPPLPEQNKIAEILTTCDKVIELKEKLIAEKQQQKKWLMQKLLTGKIRLKGFYGKWYEVTLEEFCNCLDNIRKPINSTDRAEIQGRYPYFGANNIMDYVSDYLFNEEIVLLAEDGGNFDEFNNKPIAVFVNEKCWVNNHAHILRAKNGNTKFLFYTLEHKDIRRFINGSTRVKLTQSEMLSICIFVPPTKEEQVGIATFLSTVDKEKDVLQKDLAEWKQKKKALMQLLLTGIVRVKV